MKNKIFAAHNFVIVKVKGKQVLLIKFEMCFLIHFVVTYVLKIGFLCTLQFCPYLRKGQNVFKQVLWRLFDDVFLDPLRVHSHVRNKNLVPCNFVT